MTLRFNFRWIVLLLVVALSGCIAKVDVEATASTGANVEYAYVTVSQVWLHTSATAAASDDGWVGKALATPVTIDLAQLNNGGLEELLSGLTLTQGTYRQLRLVLADSSASLTSSAQDLSLTTNSEVQYLDSSGTLATVPLELANPNGELLLPISIKVSGPASGSVVRNAIGSSGTTGTMTVLTSLVMDFNALRGLTIFDYDGQPGALFTPRLSAFNVDEVGGITGELDLSAVSYALRTSSQGVVVTAQTLSADGSHYVEANSVAVPGTGSFTLYPLPVPESGTTYYDLVVHGPGIQTIVIASVPVTASATTSVQSDAITVSVADTYPVNTSVTNNSVPASTQVDFYQTVPDDPLPHLIESATLNPYTGTFSEDVLLSTSKLIYGLYSDGDDIVYSTVTPDEGVGTYQIVTRAPLHALSAWSNDVSSNSTATTVSIDLPSMDLESGAVAETLSGIVTLGTLNYYDAGFVLISHGGQLLDVVNLTDALAATGIGGQADFSISNVPGGIESAVYDVSVRLWNSSNPANTLLRKGLSTPVDLRSASVDTITIPVP